MITIKLHQKSFRLCALCIFLPLGMFTTTQALADNFYIDGQAGMLVNPMKGDHLIQGTLPGQLDQNYKITNDSNALANIGVGVGLKMPFNTRWAVGLGMSYHISNAQNLSGNYYAINIGDPDNTYQYKLSLQSLMGQARLYFRPSCTWSYFAGGGVGVGFIHNSALSMQVIPYPSGVTLPLQSQASNDTRAVYELTTGVQWQFNDHWHLESGFTQSYFGKDYIKMNIGTPSNPNYSKLDMGTIDPWQLWMGVGYQF